MGNYGSVVITQAGLNMLAQAEAGQGKITLLQMKTSETNYSGGTFTAKQVANINGISVVNYKYTLNATFSNELLTADYDIMALGVFAKLDDGDPILFCYSNATVADTMPKYNGVSPLSIEYEFESGITQSDSINVTVNSQGLATLEYVDNAVEDLEDKINSVTTVTIPISGWTTNTDDDSTNYYTIDINVTGMTSAYVGTNACDYVRPATYNVAELETIQEMFNLITDIQSNDGYITVYAREIPTTAFQIYLYGVG